MTKLHKLIQGKTVQLSPSEIELIIGHLPNIGIHNYKKLEKAHRHKKGCRISVCEEELEGSGFIRDGVKFLQNNKHAKQLKNKAINNIVDFGMDKLGADAETRKVAKNVTKGLVNHGLNTVANGESFDTDPMSNIRKGAQYIKNNQELSNYKNKLVNNAVDYGMDKLGSDGKSTKLVKKLSNHLVNQGLNNLSGEGFNLKKGLKMGAKALKVGNHVSNAMGYDNLQDLAIDTVANETLGRIDPTLGRVAGNAMKKVANKKIDKYSGGSINPYLPRQLQGGSIHHNSLSRVVHAYDDQSDVIHPNSDSYLPNSSNLPMFNQLKFEKHVGGGFKVYA